MTHSKPLTTAQLIKALRGKKYALATLTDGRIVGVNARMAQTQAVRKRNQRRVTDVVDVVERSINQYINKKWRVYQTRQPDDN